MEFISNSSLSTISNNNQLEMRKDTSLAFGYDYGITSTIQGRGLIARLVDDYREQRERRRMMLCHCLEEIMNDEVERILKGPASILDYVDIFKVQVVLMHEWVLSLEEFK
ncbi:hypothetical protein LOAG_12835 [Loa loa]|nr:hypothetical protein LOAG_12835 [Loa loa]EFO15675.1 hypothetical protein LOAG_12835 [Loa loa]